MNKTLRTFSLCCLAVLYSCIISLYSSNTVVDPSSVVKFSNADGEHYRTDVPSNLFCSLIQTASPATTVSTQVSPAPATKTPCCQFAPYAEVTERMLSNTFTQYRFYANKVLIRLLETDLIFPFHYFW